MSIQPDLLEDGWIEMRDGDESCRTIFDRHYSRYRYADGRKPKLFLGPGEKMVLFRGDGSEIPARRRWPNERFYTYVDPAHVKPTMVRGVPCWGWCFFKAGWSFAGVTKNGKIVWEKPPREASGVNPNSPDKRR